MSFETIAIEANGVSYTQWESVSVTAGIRQATRGFEVTTTEFVNQPFKVGDTVVDWNFPPGVPVKITANGDPLLTGYVFLYAPSASPEQHQVRIAGRGKGADYIDSSVFPDGRVWDDKTVPEISKDLMAHSRVPFDLLGSAGAPIRYFAPRRGASVFTEIIRLAQQRGLVIGEDADGKAVMRARDAKLLNHEGGLIQGNNIIAMSARLSANDAFDEIAYVGQSSYGWDRLKDLQPYAAVQPRTQLFPRFRYKELVSPTATDEASAKIRAATELFRMYGWETQAQITVPGFRDIGGTIWQPGFSAFVSAPFLHIDGQMIIDQVEYVQNDRIGSVTNLTLVDPAVYSDKALVLGSGSIWPLGRTPDAGAGNWFQDITKDPPT
jgi:prophage tail gpP-like protein